MISKWGVGQWTIFSVVISNSLNVIFLLVAILATVTNLGGNPGAGGTGLCRLEELHFILLIELIYSKLCVNRLRISA